MLIHAFFYSDYHTILTDLDRHCLEKWDQEYEEFHSQLLQIEEEIQVPFLDLYNECLSKHTHPKIHYERGMVLFHRGENLDSFEDIRKFIAYAEKKNYQELLTSELYLTEGRLLSESLSYDEAVVALTKSIAKDPKNKDAYFERAIAYFELGDFQSSLADYLAAGFHPQKMQTDPWNNASRLGQGFAQGILKGAKDSATEFVPSLLSSLRGLGRGLWAFVSDPISLSQDMIESAHACFIYLRETSAKEMLETLAPEIQDYITRWRSLDYSVQGETMGYIIGKYGIDIFIASGSAKAIQLYRNLRKANALMTLEAASVSPKLMQEVLAQAVKEEVLRKRFLSTNLRIHWDRQGKHIPGRHNYEPGKSIFSHPDPQKLVNQYAGTGRRVNHSVPGTCGYKENIDFQEVIGTWINDEKTVKVPTTNGMIVYSNEGVHIIPTRPNP